MLFCEKLDFLMKITNTTNSSLSMYASLDASFISRLRNGKRNPVKNEAYIGSMARYFSRRCTEGYQRKALFDALKISGVYTETELCNHILQWLTDEQSAEYQNVGRFLARMTVKSSIPVAAPTEPGPVAIPGHGTSVFYGVSGKREAVVCFLSEVAARSKPLTLLLFSDEPTDWMASDPAFAAKWASLMFAVLAKGNRIKIIHTVSRDLDEMLNAISQWIPLYMTGLIEPYYYPKKRDGLFKRTLFIAPGVAAVVSTSVGGGMIDEAANFLLWDAKAVSAVEQEFSCFFRLCSPLVRIFTANAQNAYLDMMAEFESKQADTLMKTESLSLLTMPESVAASILQRVGRLHIDLTDYNQSRARRFVKSLSTNSFTEIVHLPEPQAVSEGKVVVAFSDVLHGGTVYYTATEFILHLEHIISLLKKYENFHVCLMPREADTRYMLYVKEGIGAIVAKTSLPPAILAISEENMTAAFWGFLGNMAGEKACSNPNNDKTAKAISDYIRRWKARNRI